MTDTPESAVSPEETEYPPCYRHPDVQMAVWCSRCRRPICTDCMIPADVGYQCPDCAQQGAPRKGVAGSSACSGSGWQQTPTGAPVTLVLIAINVLVFLAGITPQLNERILIFGAAFPAQILNGEWYRLVTSLFIHSGLFHILLNMVALWILGSQLEQLIGRVWYGLLYMACGIAGGVVFVLMATQNVPAVGASGGIAGLFGAILVVVIRKRGTPQGALILRQLLLLLVLNIVISLLPGIAWQAHLGGVIAGFGIGFAIDITKNTLWRALTVGGVMLVCAAALVVRASQLGFG